MTDLANAKRNWNKTPGYTEAETSSFKNILDPPEDVDAGKFVDVWRQLHPKDQHYTYFSYRFNCRLKGLGWRLDMCKCSILNSPDVISKKAVVLSERIAERVKMVSFSCRLLSICADIPKCEIRSEIYGASDHCPVVLEVEGLAHS